MAKKMGLAVLWLLAVCGWGLLWLARAMGASTHAGLGGGMGHGWTPEGQIFLGVNCLFTFALLVGTVRAMRPAR